MRRKLPLLLLAAALCTLHSTTARAQDDATDGGGIVINEANFPDEAFRNELLSYDLNGDGTFSQEEILTLTNMSISGGEFHHCKV